MADASRISPDAPPPRSGSSKTLLWVLGIAAVCLLLCCGGGGLLVWTARDFAGNFVANIATSDPAEIRQQTSEMVDMEIPDSYKPQQGMNLGIFRMLTYQAEPTPEGGAAMLMLMEMTIPGADNDQQEQELRKSMQQQTNQDFQQTKSETREIDIGGDKVPFEFAEGRRTEGGKDKVFHKISGVIRGKQGRPVMLLLMIPDEQFDDEAVMEMLESIQ